MKPVKLTLNAFGPFASRQEIDFTALEDDEIFLVTGETGAGKTTIFDGMSFALYGGASGDVRKPSSFKSDHASAGELCWAEFTFLLHERKYFLHRSPAQRGVKRDGSPKDISPSAELTLPDGSVICGATAVTEHVEQILGLNHRQFKQTTMLAQGEFRQLIEANGREKQQILSKIFGTSVYSDITELLTREEAALERTMQSLQESIARCIHDLAGYGHTALSDTSAQFLPFGRVETLVRDAMNLHAEKSLLLDGEIEALEEQRSRLDPEQAKALNDKLDRRDKLRLLSLELEEKEPEILEAEKRLASLKAAAELSEQEKIILSSKRQMEQYGQQTAELEARLSKLDKNEQLLLAKQNIPSPELQTITARLNEQEALYQKLYRAFLDGQAALLALRLADGEECPVCGSTHHPSPAYSDSRTPSEKDVNDAKAAVDMLVKQLERRRDELRNAYWQAKNDRDKCIAQLESTKEHHTSLIEQFENQRAAFLKNLSASGFSGYKSYRAALEEKSAIPGCELKIESHRRSRVTVSAQLEELERDTQNRKREDIDSLINLSGEIARRLAVLRESKTDLSMLLTNSESRLGELHRLHEENLHIKRKYEIAHELASLARGSRTVSFERYVLASYFDDIIKLSNIHLQRMTGSRHRLRRRGDSERGSGSGLDMEIIDNHTGTHRDVATLSGGEGFKASLALALGLSGVVQMYSGGVSIDAMFIDEGFGSLDEKSLDSAVETLFSLKKSGRMVGIISHVPQLRGYIPRKLAVRYSPTGSTVDWLT